MPIARASGRTPFSSSAHRSRIAPSSVRDCLEGLWPKPSDGARFYSHEPWSMEVVGIFFDEAWWQEHLQTEAPGFSGSGVGVIPGLGYAQKRDIALRVNEGERLQHPSKDRS